MIARIQPYNEINRAQWDKLVSESQQGSVFMETGYLDTILPNAWSGATVYENNELVAIMPIAIKQKWGFNYALQPIMAKYWGIAFGQRDNASPYKEYSFKKKVVSAILECIPQNLVAFDYNFHPAFGYPLPFFWKSYALKTAYTYILDGRGKSENEIFNAYAPGLKDSIRTAQKNEITIIKDHSAESLIHILDQNKSNGKIVYEAKYYAILQNVAAYGLNCGKCFCLTALDNKKQPVASSIYMKDKHSVYALMHAVVKAQSKTDSLSYLVHHAVMESVNAGLKFDFLGSMLEQVESFNRRFGALPHPYLNISKKNKFLFAFAK